MTKILLKETNNINSQSAADRNFGNFRNAGLWKVQMFKDLKNNVTGM